MNRNHTVTLSILLLFVSVGVEPSAVVAAERPTANPPAVEGRIEFSTLITARNVTQHLATERSARDLARRLRDVGIRRVWIEVVRGGHLVKSATLRLARDLFREEGLIASGALTTTWGPGFGVRSTGRHFLCYSAPETHRALAESARVAARVFDEIMVDDFLATQCRCDRCTREKGERTWAEYRCELRSRVARQFIVEPIHEANSDAVVIIKFPQWYDRFHYYGYDVIRDTDSFDAIWVGMETRGPDTSRFGYVPTYQSTIVYRWLRSIAGAKTRGGWFDVYDCTPDDYVDQAYSTVLAGATELMRFHAMDILPGTPHDALLVEFDKHRPHIEALARRIHGRLPLGVIAYKPAYSSAGDEEYFLDFLGDLGVPINATAHFPVTRKNGSVLLTRTALHDADIDRKLVEWSAAGGNVVATTGFLAGASREVHDLFGLQSVRSEPVDGVELQVDGQTVASPEPLALGGFLEPRTAAVRLACRVGRKRVPILTAATTGTGALAVAINLRTHEGRDGVEGLLTERPVTWLDLPESAANRLRETVLDGTGLTMKAPSRVIAHALTGGLLVLINTRDTPIPVSLKLGPPWYVASGKALVIEPGGQRVEPSGDGSYQLTLPPRARWSLLLSGE